MKILQIFYALSIILFIGFSECQHSTAAFLPLVFPFIFLITCTMKCKLYKMLYNVITVAVSECLAVSE